MKNKDYTITYWYGPPSGFTTEEVYRKIKEAGFNLAAPGPLEKGLSEYESNMLYLDVCEKNGIKGCVSDSRMRKGILGEEGWEEALEGIVKDYSGHPALECYYVVDEPNTKDFPNLGKIVAKLRELDSKHYAYINLFPNYATPEQLGSPTYREHVEDYIKIVKPEYVSYDHYHFLTIPDPNAPKEIVSSGNEREDLIRKSAMINVDRGGFFDNLEDVRDLCLKYDLPFMVIVLLIEHGPYRYLKPGEIMFEIFQCLTYGASYLSYFTYWTVLDEPDSWWQWKNAMVDKDGTLLQHYYDVKDINVILQNYGRHLVDQKTVKVMHFGPEKERVTPFAPDDMIKDIKATCQGGEAQLTIGEFTGGYLGIANKNINLSVNIDVNFGDCEKCFVVSGKDGSLIELAGAGSCVEIQPGEMVLYKVQS